jgi:type I restriction enzyme, S subunit
MRMSNKKHAQLVPKLRFPEFLGAGGWDADDLGLVAYFVNEKIALEQVALENYVSTENILADYGGIGKASKLPKTGSVTRFQLNDTLVSNIRPYLKKVWIADREGGASNDVIVIRAKQRLLPQYLSALLKNDAFIDYVMTGAKGVKMPRGDVGSMKAYQALYPPKPEQQKIADCLSSLDELIAAQARKVDALKTHKKGLMQQLFTREGETQPRLRFPEFRDAGEWDEQSIGDFGKVITGNTPSTTNSDFYGGDIPFVSPADISDLRLVDQTKTTLTAEGFAETRPVRAGSILFVCIGSTIGKVAQNVRDCATNQQINAVIPNSKHSSGFVYFALSVAAERIALLAGKQAVPIVNKSLFSSVRIRVPKLLEQQRIASCLVHLDTQHTSEIQILKTLRLHKKALMQKLFPLAEDAS